MSFDPRDPADPYDNPRPQRPDLPYRDPLDPYAPAGENAKQAARGKVIGPAVFLILSAMMNLFVGGYLILDGVYINSLTSEAFETQLMQPEQVQDLKKQGITPQRFQSISFVSLLVLGLLTLLAALIILAGGICMLGLKMWGLGVTASVLALVTPGGCCCLVGLPAGIWGLIALMNTDVRTAFR